MTGEATIVLWEPAEDSMLELPDFSRPLGHPLVWSVARNAATKIGYRIL